jgi:hypothetical protein
MKIFNVLSEEQKTILLAHEMFHAKAEFNDGSIYNEHDNSELEDGCAASIMNEYMPPKYCVQKHEDYYINEINYLFN